MLTESPIVRTPLIPAGRIFLKPENLQPFGSYKIRGVFSAVQSAPRELVSQGLHAASAGNMAQAVAFMAQRLDVPCTIYVPDAAPEVKKQAIRNLGAKLIELSFAEVWEKVRKPPTDMKGLFIHPVFTPGLLEGYGQIGKELLADRPSLGAVVIPFGVGGLTLGIARALKALKPEIQIYAAEPETAAPLSASLSAGKPTSITRIPSFVDAIGTPEVLPNVFTEARKLVTESIVVSLDETRSALARLVREKKLITEGAAAAGFAASVKLADRNPKMEIACILSGGNLSEDVLLDCLKQ